MRPICSGCVFKRGFRFGILGIICLLLTASSVSIAAPPASAGNKIPNIPIATIQHPGPVDFEKEILPIFSDNCLACHNKIKAKSGFVLETPADIRKGGDDGSVTVIPGKGSESLLLQAVSHDPKIDAPMPPANNKVAAADLTPQQLGLIKLWIDQGATGEVHGSLATVKWRAIPATLDPIYAVAITPGGRLAATGRANRIDVYDLPAGKLTASLVDPQLAGAGLVGAHRDMVESLAFSPDGNMLASGSFREVKLWRKISSGEKLTLGDKAVAIVAAAPDGKRIATAAGDDGAIDLWDPANGKSVGQLSGQASAIISLQFSPDGSKLLALSKDQSICVWDVDGNKTFCKVKPEGDILCAAWVGNHSVAVGNAAGVVVGYMLPGNAAGAMTVSKTFKDSAIPVTVLFGIPGDDAHFLFARKDGGVFRASLASGSLQLTLKTGGAITAMLIRPDGKRLVILGDDHVARIWTINEPKPIAELKGDPAVAAVIATADHALGLAKNEVVYRKTRLDAAEKQATAAADRANRAKDAMSPIEAALANAQSALDAAGEAADAINKTSGTAEPIDAKVPQTKPSDPNIKASTNQEAFQNLAKRQQDLTDAKLAKAAADDEVKLSARDVQDSSAALADARPAADAALERVKLREKEAADARQNAAALAKPIRAIALSADGSLIATTDDDGAVHTWSSERGAAGEVIPGGGAAVASVELIGRDRVIICPNNAPPTVLTPSTTWTLERTLSSGDSMTPFADRVMSIDFSPDGRLLATGGGVPSRAGDIRIFDVATGLLKNSFDNVHSDTILCIRFSPDGSRLASASADRMVRLLDPTTGKVIHALEGHGGHALSVAWSHDGHTLASTGADNTLRFWDAETGQRGKIIENFDKEVSGVTFVGDDTQAVVTTGDGKIRLIKDNGNDIRAYPGATDFLYGVAASVDGATLIAGGQDGILRAWDAGTGQPTGTYGAGEIRVLPR